MRKNAITVKRILLILLIAVLTVACITGCNKSADVKRTTEGSAESRFRDRMANANVKEISVDKDLVLESPVEMKGTKVIKGEGSITAVGDNWADDAYMIIVPSDAQLTVEGSVVIDAGGKAGGIHVAQNAVWNLEETASVQNASVNAANTLVEGAFYMNGGSMANAMGHNVYNKGQVELSDGEIIGSGEKYAGIYSEGDLTQNGGCIRDAYNNVSVLSGSFTFNAGSNQNSIRDGIHIAEGATLSVTSKDAAITGSGVRGIYLFGTATIENITLNTSADTLLKVGPTGTLDLKGGTLADSGYHAVENAGKMVMTGGTVRNSYNCGIVNTGALEITGGSIMDNANNKAVLNKHNGTATISGSKVMFSGNRYAIANQDTAALDLFGAELLLSTVTNVYAYDGTVNIHDISLGASGSNNVRIYKADVTMSNVQVMGNSASGSTTTHGILLEGGVLNAKDITIKNTTGYGIRNKGGQVTAENVLISKSSKAGGIYSSAQDFTGKGGEMDVKNLTIEEIRYNNVVVDGGSLTITDGKLSASGTNNTKVAGGKLVLKNVDILGNQTETDGRNHAVYVTDGVLQMHNVNISDAKFSGLRVDGDEAVISGSTVKISNSGEYGIDLTRGFISLNYLTTRDNHYNIVGNKGTIQLNNADLGPTASNNVRINSGTAVLNDVLIRGHIQDHVNNVHGLFINDGKVTGKNITIQNVANVGLRVKGGTTTLQDLKIKDAGADAVWISDGKATISGLEVEKAGSAGVSATGEGNIQVVGGNIKNTSNHGVKSENEAKLTLENICVAAALTDGRYAVLAQGGNVQLKDVTLIGVEENISGAGIRVNRDTSVLTGEGVSISGMMVGISTSAGTTEISGLTTDKITSHNVHATQTAKVTVSDATLGVTGTNNAKAESGGIITLNNVVIEGTEKNHGLMVENGGYLYGTNVTVRNTVGSAVRVKCGDAGNVIELDGLVTENIGVHNVYINKDKDAPNVGSVQIKNSNLCRTSSHSVIAEAGTVTLTDTKIQGHLEDTADNIHAVYVCGAADKVVLQDITVLEAAGDALRISAGEVTSTNFTSQKTGRYGIWADGGKLTAQNTTVSGSKIGVNVSGTGSVEIHGANISGSGSNNISVSNGTLTVNGYADGSESQIGTSAEDNIKASGAGVVRLNNVKVLESAKNNMVAIDGGTIYAAHTAVTGGNHSILADKDGKVYLNNVSIANSATSGIRANHTGSYVEGEAVTIDGANTGLSIKSGTVKLSNIAVKNTTAVGIDVRQADAVANVTLTDLVTENCGTHAIYTSGADAKLTVNGAELSNDGSDHVINLNGGPMVLHDVTVKATLAAGKYELYSGAGWLTIGGQIDADIYIATDPGRVIKVNKELTGDQLKLEWANTPSGNALEFTTGEMMDASMEHITLGATQMDAGVDSFETIKDANGKGYAKLANRFVTNEAQLTAALKQAQDQNLADVTIQIGGSFTVSKQVTIPGNIQTLTICDDGNSATGNTITYSGGTDGMIVVTDGIKLTVKDISMASTPKMLLKQEGGELVVENCALSSVKNCIRMTGGTAVVNGVKIADGSTNSILVTGGELTVNGYSDGSKSQIGSSTEDNVRVEGEGVIRLNDVNVLASVKNTVVAINGGTIHMTNTTVNGGNHSILADKDGKVYLNNVSIANSATSGIRANHTGSYVEGEAVTIDGANTGLSIKSGTVKLSNITVKNTTAVGIDVRQADAVANVTLTDLVTENCGTHAIYTSGADAKLTVNGAELSNDGSDHVINLNGGPMVLHDVTVKATLAAGKYELYSGAGWLTIGGQIDADIYIATNPGRVIKVDQELTGNDLTLDWKYVPTGNALSFTNAEMLNGSKDHIRLASTLGAGYMLQYETTAAKVIACTKVTSWTELNQKVSTQTSGSSVNYLITGNASDWQVNTTLTCPDGAQVTLYGDENAPQLLVGAGVSPFALGANSQLTVMDLTIGGTASAKAAHIVVPETATLTLRNATLQYFSDAKGGAVHVDKGTLIVADSVFTNNNATEYGGAIYIKSSQKATITGASFSNNASKYGGAIDVESGGGLSVENSTFTGNKCEITNGEGGAIRACAILTVKNSSFTNNLAVKNGGAIVMYASGEISDCTFTGNSGYEGGAISLATGHSLDVKNIECSNNTTTRVDSTYSTTGFGDIRVADNNSKGQLSISGKIVASIWNNQAHSITVKGALTEGSNVIVDWRFGKLSANKVGIVFGNKEIMNASKSYIQLGKDAAEKEGWKFQYSSAEPWRAILVKA